MADLSFEVSHAVLDTKEVSWPQTLWTSHCTRFDSVLQLRTAPWAQDTGGGTAGVRGVLLRASMGRGQASAQQPAVHRAPCQGLPPTCPPRPGGNRGSHTCSSLLSGGGIWEGPKARLSKSSVTRVSCGMFWRLALSGLALLTSLSLSSCRQLQHGGLLQG